MKSDKKHINLETLKNLGTGFTVPKNYFEEFEVKVLSKVSSDIPKGYFENFEDKIFNRLKQDNIPQVKVITLRQKIVKRYVPILAAASVVLFIGLNFYNNSNTISFDSLDTTNISTWLEGSNYNASDSYVLGELLDTDDISNLTALNESILDDIQLIDYLDNTDIGNLNINN